MEKHESEQVIREVIEYANKEIQKSRRKSRYLMGSILLGVLVLLSYRILVYGEIPVAYREGIVTVEIPADKGLDIYVNLDNYKNVNAVLMKTGENTYDLCIGIMQTCATKVWKDPDPAGNLLRVGNGLIYDFQSERLLGFLPEGNQEDAIRRIYYLDNLAEEAVLMTDQEFLAYEGKTLIWEREP